MRTVVRFVAVAILLLTVSACGIIDAIYLPPSEDTAQELFEAGNDAMREKDYASAVTYYTKLKDNFQFSPYVLEAELSLADALFLDEEWASAIEAYKEFESLHPRHEAIPYVLSNIGMAYYNMYPSIDRPITPITESYSYFKRVYESFPNSEYAPEAQKMMKACRVLMAQNELYYADFYYRMGKYGSAWRRYKGILANFKDVPEVYTHAEEKSQSAFILYRQSEATLTREKREGTWKQLFDWL